MKAVVVDKDDRVKLLRGETTSQISGSVEIVQVHYAGVGFADVMAAKGGYVLAPKAPFSPGYEIMGTVTRQGKLVRVLGLLTTMNGYRDQVPVSPQYVIPVPDDVSDETAAAIPLNYLTALAMVERLAKLKPGQSVLVYGAAGGVGIAVIELCKILGLKVYGSCSESKHELVKCLGAIPISRRELEASPERIKELHGGFDAVLDPFGGPSLERSWRLVRPKGMLVCYGFASTINGGTLAVMQGLGNLFLKKFNLSKKKTRLCGTPGIVKNDPKWYALAMTRLLNWAKEKKINPIIHRIYPWDQVLEAHQEIETGKVRGKILLNFSSN